MALDGTVIVAVSDLHFGSLLGKTWLAALVEQVEAEKPDLVVRIGEVFEGHSVPAAEMLTVLKAMPALLGKWGVFGNHEMHSGGDANGAIFEGAGITCCEMAGSNCAQASSWLAWKACPSAQVLARTAPRLWRRSQAVVREPRCSSPILLIGGWVAMWRPLQIFLYEWWPVVRRRRIYRNLGRASVHVFPAKG